MATHSELIQTERNAIKYSVWGNLVMGLLGLGFAAASHSYAVLLDSVYSLVSFTASLFSLKVTEMIMRPANKDYPFGYAIYEPMFNLGKGLVIFTVCLLALYSSIEALFHGGREIAAGIAFFYAVSTAVVCLVIARILYHYAKRCESPIVSVDAKNWILDGILSAVIGGALLVVYLLEESRFKAWLPYADPVAVILLVMLFLPIPYRIIRDNWAQVLGRNTDPEIRGLSEEAVRECFHGKPVQETEIRALRAGRFIYLQVFIVVARDEAWPRKVRDEDEYRETLRRRLGEKFRYLIIDVVFTTDEKWINQVPEVES
ncbi:cation diffusion facilitator family transporter [Rubellicoccus peritrichatus]|uniref:Cation diffusion facilitator family transporter n=1 Tax=Rubellicoccus peritrichatus TaxID=3080537 RepID=A0AAQ3LIE3_9BACT|nr:cation diffusion facilitator family transporter [Puniceicoccus sp. CR14]WOO42649.1 cation diffusion facilitator family transporter [Puniceicoccus sp. CR14]